MTTRDNSSSSDRDAPLTAARRLAEELEQFCGDPASGQWSERRELARFEFLSMAATIRSLIDYAEDLEKRP